MVLKITNLHILRYLPTCWLYLLERYTIDNQGCTHTASKTTTCYCSHQCSNLSYKEHIRERKRQMRKMQELLQPKQAAEGQDFFSFAQAAKLMGVTRQYVYKLVKESKLRASRISGKKSLIRRADIELMLKTKTL